MHSRLAATSTRAMGHPDVHRGATAGERAEVLQRFLQAYWLRPENALWMTLRSEVLSRFPLERPSVDLSCGDGVFSFLHSGGVFDPAFDVFTSVRVACPSVRGHEDDAWEEHAHAGVSMAPATGARRDSRTSGADMFDCVSDDYQPVIVSAPVRQRWIDVGTDIKPALLAKAKRLNFYSRLVEHDSNTPLPFDDDTFQTVYCNAAYWIWEIDRFLAQLARITRPGGRVILQVKLDSMRRYTLERYRRILGDRFVEIIDRGRTESWPTIASRSTWERRFAAAGLPMVDAIPFVTKTHAHIWDIGLRPVAPLLIKMAGALAPETRAAIKREWVDLLCEMLEPLCDPKLDLFTAENEPAEIQYVLTRG